MAFNKKTIKDIDVKDKRILVRVDYNVPIDDDGSIADDYRIKKSLPTLQYLLEQGCSLVLCSHLGRPKSAQDKSCTLEPVASRLGELLDRVVQFSHQTVGKSVKEHADRLQPGDIMLLENLRYQPEEESNDSSFAQQLADLADIFVQDGFGVVHRAHASTDAVARLLPSVAGLLVEKEVDTITSVMHNPKRPLMAIIGGSKIADKIDILNRFIDIADVVVVGGAMANTFLLAKGIEVGKSKVDTSDLPLAREIMAKAEQRVKDGGFVFYLPQDGVVAKNVDASSKTRIVDWDAHVIADIESYPKRPNKESLEVDDDEMILDVGPFSGAFIAGAMQLAGTVVWNGALGVTETESLHGPVGPFSHGTETMVEAMLGQFGNNPFTVAGGGDTVGYIEERNLVEQFNHVSTGGGASMELMSGKSLPGVEVLLDREQSE